MAASPLLAKHTPKGATFCALDAITRCPEPMLPRIGQVRCRFLEIGEVLGIEPSDDSFSSSAIISTIASRLFPLIYLALDISWPT